MTLATNAPTIANFPQHRASILDWLQVTEQVPHHLPTHSDNRRRFIDMLNNCPAAKIPPTPLTSHTILTLNHNKLTDFIKYGQEMSAKAAAALAFHLEALEDDD